MKNDAGDEVERVREMVRDCGPLVAYQRLIADNDRWITGPDLDHNRRMVRQRTAIHTELIRQWAVDRTQEAGYDKPFAVVTLGGTGRGEITPASDLDIALLFDDEIEGNRFLLNLQQETVQSDQFASQYGFSFKPFPFGLDDLAGLREKQLNAFLDMTPLHDPQGLAPVFRERIRRTFDPFEHFLHVRNFWKEYWQSAADASENLRRFDIKNAGLRLFLCGIWALAGKDFRHSHEIYATLEDDRDLAAYEFLLRIRSWVHLRRGTISQAGPLGNHAEDVLGFEDFRSFGAMLGTGASERDQFDFANEVRARLLSARRRVAAFARGVIEQELRKGRPVPPEHTIVLRAGGLQLAKGVEPTSPEARSRAALGMLLAAQHYGVPVDSSELQTNLRNLGDWLVPVPELSALFYETRGSLADTMAFLTQLDGAVERLLPGFRRFETSLDERVMQEQESLRGTWVREKLRTLEECIARGAGQFGSKGPGWIPLDADLREMVSNQVALLDSDQLAAIRLALMTKRLPLTAEDEAARRDESLPLHEREASGFSGIPLEDYYAPFVARAGFSAETVRLAQFLVTHRRILKRAAERALSDDVTVRKLADTCADENTLRALFVFSCIDTLVGLCPERCAGAGAAPDAWSLREANPARWFNVRELYVKTIACWRPDVLPDPVRALKAAGYHAGDMAILLDFGKDFFGGLYGRQAMRFGGHLLRLVEDADAGPKAALLRDGGSVVLGVAARDFRGLAACITGALWKEAVNLRQAHLFSATKHRLALDFFHLEGGGNPVSGNLPRMIEEAIVRQLHIADEDEQLLPPLDQLPELGATASGNYRLRYETGHDTAGLVYALAYKVFRHLGGTIHCLSADTIRGRTFISVIHSLPADRSLDEAKKQVASRFMPR